MMPSRRDSPVRGPESGQATTEYLLIVMAILMGCATISVLGHQHCLNDLSGTLSPASCSDPVAMVKTALHSSIDELTFLINLPF